MRYSIYWLCFYTSNHKYLAVCLLVGIIALTCFLRSIGSGYDSFFRPIQAQAASAASRAPSSSREGHRATLSRRSVLRSSRPRPGQIRTAPQRPGRWPIHQSRDFVLWTVASNVLRDARCFRTCGYAGAASREEGTSPRPQALRGGNVVRRRAARARAYANTTGAGGTHRRALRRDGAPTQRCPGARATRKKKPLEPTRPARGRLATRYEQLRQSVRSGNAAPSGGLAILLHQGLAVWMQLAAADPCLQVDPNSDRHVASAPSSTCTPTPRLFEPPRLPRSELLAAWSELLVSLLTPRSQENS